MLFYIANMPYISLGWIGLGFFVLLVSFFVFVHQQSKKDQYTAYDEGKELFSFFLEEEEKKNEAFRESIKNEYDKSHKPLQPQETLYNDIIRLYQENLSIEEIAKQMKIGIGEVRLIVSLYSMR